MKSVQDDMLMQVPAKSRKLSVSSLLLFLIALSPAVYLGWLISATAVNVLIMDEWDYVFLFRRLVAHTLTLHDLLRQHNESRTTLANIIVLVLGVLTHRDTRWDMWVTFLFACVISVNIYLLGRRTMSRRQALFLWAVANVLIFSTAQSQNWTWGIQMIVYMPIMFITLGLLVAYSRMNVTWKFLACMVLATASTYSYANGQLAWVLLLIALVIGSREQTRKLGWRIGMWGAGFAANMWVYYRDYHSPTRSPRMLLLLKHPIDAMQYFAAFLGASLGEGFQKLWVSVVFGGVLLVCLAIACHYLWRRRGQKQLGQSASLWLLVAAYAVASAAVTTVGRVGLGVGQSQDSRYTTFSLYLVVGLIYLAAIIVKDAYRQGRIAAAWIWTCFGLALVLLPQIVTQVDGYQQMWVDRRAHLTEKACIQLINIAVVPQWLLHPVPQRVIDGAAFLDKIGFLSPGLVKDRDLSRIAGDAQDRTIGYFDGLDLVPNAMWYAHGWAVDPKKIESAEVVILAAEDSRGEPRGFAVAIVLGDRTDVANREQHAEYANSGWGLAFKPANVPPGTVAISAWAYDPTTGLAYRLIGSFPWAQHAAGH